MTTEPFKSCPNCGEQWATRDALVSDPQVEFIGYQAFVRDGVLGLFMFNHLKCGTTMAISAKDFADLRDQVYDPSARHEEEHSSYCLSAPSSGPCPETCECAFVEEVIDTITR